MCSIITFIYSVNSRIWFSGVFHVHVSLSEDFNYKQEDNIWSVDSI